MSSIFSRHPEPGDTVRLTSDVRTGLLSAPAPAGSLGVVTAIEGGRVRVEVDGGMSGATTVSARLRDCRVIERGTGIERFRRRMRHRAAVRLGALILLALPLVQFVWGWWSAVGSLDGLLEHLPIALLESAADLLLLALGDPVRAALTVALGSLTWWLAFGPGRRG
ncbi:hypothetical protein Cch01nite_13700 [Cellulomonas chitinilytica]|uniref:Uncharacterized protein n=1 Tax=Cellulomonas chitinilytica TaxID=398759 RepID=A0A919U0P9_9CELL|nr:hypothetical protein [Cellulomonas chitinilytica]GIG20646.1 hypothetical protein Cch01nite_13700 [Cellulomonas chitinilytica]